MKLGVSLAIAVAASVQVHAQDPAQPKVVLKIGECHDDFRKEVEALVWSRDGARLAGATWRGGVVVWDAKTGAPVRTLVEAVPEKDGPHGKRAESLAFGPEGILVAGGGRDFGVRVWNTDGKELLKTTEAVGPVALSPDGKVIAAATEDDRIVLMDLPGGRIKTALSGHKRTVTSLSFSGDGKQLVSVSHDETWRLWDVMTGKELHCEGEARGYDAWSSTGGLFRGIFSPDGRHVAVSQHACFYSDVTVYDARTRREVSKQKDAGFWTFDFSPDGKRLAYRGDDAKIVLWHVDRQVRSIAGHVPDKAGVQVLTFSPDGKRLAGSMSGAIVVWDVSER